MKQLLTFTVICFLLVGCKTPDYLPKQHKIGEVEYFDLEDFEKYQEYNEYGMFKEDTISIIKLRRPEYFYERYTIYKKNYRIIKEYYPNGIIKERGKEYYFISSKNFKIGKWEYFDEQGKLIKVENKDGKDRKYKMTYKEAFRRVWWYYGFSMKDLYIDVFPTSEGLFWIFEKNGKSKAVDMNTGKVSDVKISQSCGVRRGKNVPDDMEESRRKNFESKPDSTVVNQK